MSIEGIPELDLDLRDPSSILQDVSKFESEHLPLVTLSSAIDNWEMARNVLCSLRASNISAVLLLRHADEPLEDEEILAFFTFLLEWDQLLLHNILEICDGWIPHVFLARLKEEAKIELKWFREWWVAATDARIHKYPPLPWRSFVRKITSENFNFAKKFVELVSLPATPEHLNRVQNHFNQFLEAKKRVLCLFPKKWSRLQ